MFAPLSFTTKVFLAFLGQAGVILLLTAALAYFNAVHERELDTKSRFATADRLLVASLTTAQDELQHIAAAVVAVGEPNKTGAARSPYGAQAMLAPA